MKYFRCWMFAAALAPAAHAATCDLIPPELSFGIYDPEASAPTDASALITVNCFADGGAPEAIGYSIAIGRGADGSLAPRALRGPESQLQYNLFADAAHTLIWGNGDDGSVTVAGSLSLPGRARSTHAVFGRLLPRQKVGPGDYSDQLVIILDY